MESSSAFAFTTYSTPAPHHPGSRQSLRPPAGPRSTAARAASSTTSSSGADGDGATTSGRRQQPRPSVSTAMPLQQFEVSLEEVLHHRYLTLYNRRVRFSAAGREGGAGAGEEHEMAFDVIGHPQSGEKKRVEGAGFLWAVGLLTTCLAEAAAAAHWGSPRLRSGPQ